VTDAPTLSLLLIDDNPVDREAVRRELGSGMQLVEAADLAEAAAAVEAVVFDCAILDLALGPTSGLETLYAWQRIAGDIPCVVLTGNDDEALGARLLQAGAQDFVPKGRAACALLPRAIRHAVERWQLQRREQGALKMAALGRLSAGVAHDFNNLLTVICNYGAFARDALPLEHPARADIEQVIEAGESGARLTRRLLDYTRQSAGRTQIIDLAAFVRDGAKRFGGVLGPRHSLAGALSGEPCRVEIDPDLLEQVLSNLLANARDAMPDGGEVTLAVMPARLDSAFGRERGVHVLPGPYVRVTVSDSGQGMDAETRARVFEPYFTTKKTGAGTGLGLPMCYGIIKQAGGTIWIESQPGLGTTVTLYLPQAGVSATPTTNLPNTSRRHEGMPHGNESLLVVEDQPVVRMAVARMLRGLGYTVHEAPDGETALLMLDSEADGTDLVVTDIQMPGMNGDELAAQIRARRPGLPILFITGFAGTALAAFRALDQQETILEKPLETGLLARNVRSLLDRAGNA
jgi:signal transduction histidine kinase